MRSRLSKRQKTTQAKLVDGLPAIVQKGYPQSVADYLKAECDKVTDEVSKGSDLYSIYVFEG